MTSKPFNYKEMRYDRIGKDCMLIARAQHKTKKEIDLYESMNKNAEVKSYKSPKAPESTEPPSNAGAE